jgi:hypothetical protein
MDIDMLNEINKEAQEYHKWERAEKNRILKMFNQQKKQEAWRLLFPQAEHSDDYLNGLIY